MYVSKLFGNIYTKIHTSLQIFHHLVYPVGMGIHMFSKGIHNVTFTAALSVTAPS